MNLFTFSTEELICFQEASFHSPEQIHAHNVYSPGSISKDICGILLVLHHSEVLISY